MDAATIAKTQGQALTQQEWLKEIALHLALLNDKMRVSLTVNRLLTEGKATREQLLEILSDVES